VQSKEAVQSFYKNIKILQKIIAEQSSSAIILQEYWNYVTKCLLSNVAVQSFFEIIEIFREVIAEQSSSAIITQDY
jgi:hypothetical protein